MTRYGLEAYRAPARLEGVELGALGSVFVTADEIHAEASRLGDAIDAFNLECVAHAATLGAAGARTWEAFKDRWRPFLDDTLATNWFLTGSVPAQVERFAAEFEGLRAKWSPLWRSGVVYAPPPSGGLLPAILGGDGSGAAPGWLKWAIGGLVLVYALPVLSSWVPRGSATRKA